MTSEPPRTLKMMILASPDLEVSGPGPLRKIGEIEVERVIPGDIDVQNCPVYHPDLGIDGLQTFRLGGDRTQREKYGRVLLAEVRAVCGSGDKSKLRVLIALFPSIVLRVREVHVLLDSLSLGECEVILGKCRGRGRPPEPLAHVARVRSMERIVEVHGVSKAEAARRLTAVGEHPSESTLQNLCGLYGRYVQMMREGLFVPAQELEPLEWGAPATMKLTVYTSETKYHEQEK